MKIQIKKLELQPDNKTFKEKIKSKKLRATLIGVIVGSLAGFAVYYFTEGIYLDSIPNKDIIQSLVFGALFGLFVTNSPCARNQC